MAILAEEPVDIVFLDIRMPGMSGLELASQVGAGVKVVFTTAYSDHAVDGFALNALDYLLKPVSYDEFMRAALRALPAAGKSAPEYIVVKSEYRLVRIKVSDIDYIEGLKDYVKICIAGEPKPVLSLMSMKSIEEALPEPQFMRVHRSFIVNMDRVRIVERNCIVVDGRLIPVSDSMRRRFYDALGTML